MERVMITKSMKTCFGICGVIDGVIGMNCRREFNKGSISLRFGNNGKKEGSIRNRECNFCVGSKSNGIDVGVNGMDKSEDHKTMATQELDHWLYNSLQEIVKNVDEAPLLVHIYTQDGPKDSIFFSKSSTTRMKIVMEKGTSTKNWKKMNQSWEKSIPNGVILVQELDFQQDVTTNQHGYQDKTWFLDSYTSNNNKKEQLEISSCSSSPTTTRFWGVLVQGKGVNKFPSSYLLKTCQVKCCFGSSTHFCLAKVECFENTNLDFNFNNIWLQR
ncbi:unnamed protein product [Amaranthus hypochondriacus]